MLITAWSTKGLRRGYKEGFLQVQVASLVCDVDLDDALLVVLGQSFSDGRVKDPVD
jgi:hypothetical protein